MFSYCLKRITTTYNVLSPEWPCIMEWLLSYGHHRKTRSVTVFLVSVLVWQVLCVPVCVTSIKPFHLFFSDPTELYTWGNNINFTLGHGSQQSKHHPELIDMFPRCGIYIKQVKSLVIVVIKVIHLLFSCNCIIHMFTIVIFPSLRKSYYTPPPPPFCEWFIFSHV